MKLSDRIWEELGALAQHVEVLDHDQGTARFREGILQADKDAVIATLAAHNPLIESAAKIQAAAHEQAKAEAKADNVVQYLRDHTPAECAQYVQDNVTDLASAKAFLKKVAIVLCMLSKESLK